MTKRPEPLSIHSKNLMPGVVRLLPNTWCATLASRIAHTMILPFKLDAQRSPCFSHKKLSIAIGNFYEVSMFV